MTVIIILNKYHKDKVILDNNLTLRKCLIHSIHNNSLIISKKIKLTIILKRWNYEILITSNYLVYIVLVTIEYFSFISKKFSKISIKLVNLTI